MEHSVIPSHCIICVVGAHPNFMKIAPIMVALSELEPVLDATLVHTGQHDDVISNEQYFQALGIPVSDITLEVGDVNYIIACPLVATKKSIPVIHVEAGLRSFDCVMPEEINRVLIDQISDMFFATEPNGRDNLLHEDITDKGIHFVGNVMIEVLRHNLEKAISVKKIASDPGSEYFLNADIGYAVVTMHKPSNVEDDVILASLIQNVVIINAQLPVIFPLHPRTKSMILKFGFEKLLENANILLLASMAYLEMLGLMKNAKGVLTDSGRIQEETTVLGGLVLA
ncbi:MAG: UDP-N-acetylglucosamine 2-epimerase [Undibacterium sp.]|nr:UDP-N-acetylglucosamine 2-epimerase [Undibacterium sp.]